MMKSSDVVDRVKEIFEQVTYMDFSHVELTADLEEDLGIDMDSDYPRIVAQLIRKLHIHKDAEDLLLDATTLQQVVSIINDETELG
jgi:hypothetical protein